MKPSHYVRRCCVCEEWLVGCGAWCPECKVWYRDFAWRFDAACSVLWPRKNKTRTQLNHYAPKVAKRPFNVKMQNAADACNIRWLLGDDCRNWIVSHSGGWKRHAR